MPSLDDIIWAAISIRDPSVLREAVNGNQAYSDVAGNDEFLKGDIKGTVLFIT